MTFTCFSEREIFLCFTGVNKMDIRALEATEDII